MAMTGRYNDGRTSEVFPEVEPATFADNGLSLELFFDSAPRRVEVPAIATPTTRIPAKPAIQIALLFLIGVTSPGIYTTFIAIVKPISLILPRGHQDVHKLLQFSDLANQLLVRPVQLLNRRQGDPRRVDGRD